MQEDLVTKNYHSHIGFGLFGELVTHLKFESKINIHHDPYKMPDWYLKLTYDRFLEPSGFYQTI